MRISQCRLYQTPLNPSYENVYDDYSSDAQYFNFLNNSFLDRNYILPSIRGFKHVGVNAEITIDFPSFNFYYNYLALTMENETHKYFFITNFETLYSSSSNYTFRLTLVEDVFSNYYLRIKNDTFPCTKERGHYDDIQNMIPNIPVTDEETISTLSHPSNALSAPSNPYSILWMRVWLDGENVRTTEDNNGDKNIPLSMRFLYRNSAIVCIFIPYLIVSSLSREIIDDEFKILGGHGSSATVSPVNASRFIINNTHVMKVDFTYLPPFLNYITYAGEKTFTTDLVFDIVYTDTTKFDANNAVVREYITLSDRYDAVGAIVQFTLDMYNAGLNYNAGFTYEVKLPTNYPTTRNQCDETIKEHTYEIRANMFPYKYMEVRYNDKKIPLVPIKNQNNTNKYIATKATLRQTAPNVQLVYYDANGNQIEQESWSVINNDGRYETAVDSYQDFIRNNGSYLNAKAFSTFTNYVQGNFNGAANTALGIFSGSPSQIVSGVGRTMNSRTNALNNIVSLKAQLQDADDRRDNWQTGGYSASDCLSYQDDLMIFKVEPRNYKEFQNLCWKFHRYGINLQTQDILLSNNRTYFEYAEYSDFVLIEIPMYAKEVLTQIFKNGFTRWHLGAPDRYFARYFDPSVYNVPQSYYEAIPQGD